MRTKMDMGLDVEEGDDCGRDLLKADEENGEP